MHPAHKFCQTCQRDVYAKNWARHTHAHTAHPHALPTTGRPSSTHLVASVRKAPGLPGFVPPDEQRGSKFVSSLLPLLLAGTSQDLMDTVARHEVPELSQVDRQLAFAVMGATLDTLRANCAIAKPYAQPSHVWPDQRLASLTSVPSSFAPLYGEEEHVRVPPRQRNPPASLSAGAHPSHHSLPTANLTAHPASGNARQNIQYVSRTSQIPPPFRSDQTYSPSTSSPVRVSLPTSNRLVQNQNSRSRPGWRNQPRVADDRNRDRRRHDAISHHRQRSPSESELRTCAVQLHDIVNKLITPRRPDKR